MVLGGHFRIRRTQRFLVTVDSFVCQFSVEVTVFRKQRNAWSSEVHAMRQYWAGSWKNSMSAPEVDSCVALLWP